MALAHPVLPVRRAALWAAAWCVGLAVTAVHAGPPARSAPERPADRSITEWLMRMHDASRTRSYVGTLVVSSSSGELSSARIWHACDGPVQVERVDALTGARRSTFRRNDEVVTFLPESRVARTERREALGVLTDLLKPSETSIPDFYEARRVGDGRVAGFQADIIQLKPRDGLRYGYRIWSEKKTGLVVKTQTVDSAGAVLEQAAFSELQLDAPVRVEKLAQQMAVPDGWRVERSEATKTTAAAEGWALRQPVAGFRQLSCYKRPAEGVLQWTFSDGLASVSLFVEAFDRERHSQEVLFSSGATHTLTRRLHDWWLTAVGEVPAQTLKAFAESLERRK